MAALQTETTDNDKVTIVIPTYKRSGLALALAKQIRSFDDDIEIIIIDQENTSEVDATELKRLHVRYFNLPSSNTSEAKNKGILESSGNIIIFFDDDVEITPETIPMHLEAYNDQKVAGVSGRVLNDDEKIPENTEVETGRTNVFGTKFLWQYWSTKSQMVDFPYGCNMSFRKSVLKRVGGFDKRLPKIFEEIDLGVRITRKEGLIQFVPKALIYHHKAPVGGTRTQDIDKTKMIYYHYGVYLAKNIPFPLSFLSLLLRTKTVLLEAPRAVTDLYKGYITLFINDKHNL